MRPVSVLKTKGLLSWPELRYGLYNKWIQGSDIIEFAIAWLEKYPAEVNKKIVFMAGCNPSDEGELKELLESYIAEANVSDENVTDKWRLAFLIVLKMEPDENIRLRQLQEIYADFAYPPDMKKCSIYVTDDEIQKGYVSSPLSEMEHVIQRLEKRLNP